MGRNSAASSAPLDIVEDTATGNQFITYTSKDGVSLELRFAGEVPWFTQRDIAGIFGVDTDTVADHITKFPADGEIGEVTTGKFPVVRMEGARQVTREILHYNLDVAFYVAYRVNSTEGKLFRRWATNAPPTVMAA